MGAWIATMQHPTFQLDRFGLMALRRFDGVVPAPSSTEVPAILAEEIALATHSSFVLPALSARAGLQNMRLVEPGQRDGLLEHAFSTTLDLDGARILLVDDVVVSSATLRAAARTLKNAGAIEVTGLAAVRAIWKGE
jgi:predicted amidophosphoribosyltransferase